MAVSAMDARLAISQETQRELFPHIIVIGVLCFQNLANIQICIGGAFNRRYIGRLN